MTEWDNLTHMCFKKEKFTIYAHDAPMPYKLKVVKVEGWNSSIYEVDGEVVKRGYTTIVHLENRQCITIGDENMRHLLWHGRPANSGYHDDYTIIYDNSWNKLASHKRIRLLKAFRKIAGDAVIHGMDDVDVTVVGEGKEEPLLYYTINCKLKSLIKTHTLRKYQITHFLTYLNDMYHNEIGGVKFNITRRD